MLFFGIQVSSVALHAPHIPLLPGLRPSGQAACSCIVPPTGSQCTVTSSACHCHRRVPLSGPAMLAAFNASPWGFSVSFLWWPQGLPGLGQFQRLSCERLPPSVLSRRVCIIMIMGNGLSILQLSKALPTLYSHCLLIFTFSLKAKQNKSFIITSI